MMWKLFSRKVWFGRLTTAAAIVAFSKAAIAAPLVAWDCFLASSTNECPSLRSSLFNSMPYLVPMRRGGLPDVEVSIRSFELGRGIQVVTAFHGRVGLPSFEIRRFIPTTTSSDGALAVMLADIQRGLVPYLESVQVASTEAGVTTMSLFDPSQAMRARAANLESSKWYFNVGGSGAFSLGTSSSLTGLVAGELNYSSSSWRLNLQTMGALRASRVDYGQGLSESASSTQLLDRLTVARHVAKQWSLGSMITLEHDSQNNLHAAGKMEGGLEWDLVPILTTNDHSLGFRYTLSIEHQVYLKPAVFAEHRGTFGEHNLSGYLTWHFDSLDLSGAVVAGSGLTGFDYARVTGEAAATLRISAPVYVSLSATTAYRRALRSEPREAGDTAFTQLVAGGNFAQFTSTASVTLVYTFGNSALSRQDQRWRKSPARVSSEF